MSGTGRPNAQCVPLLAEASAIAAQGHRRYPRTPHGGPVQAQTSGPTDSRGGGGGGASTQALQDVQAAFAATKASRIF